MTTQTETQQNIIIAKQARATHRDTRPDYQNVFYRKGVSGVEQMTVKDAQAGKWELSRHYHVPTWTEVL